MIWDMINDSAVFIDYCPIEYMVADYLTKPLSGDKFDQMVGWLGLKATSKTS